MRRRKKQIIALVCALTLVCGSDIIRVRADVPEEVMLESTEEVMSEDIEDVIPEATEEVVIEGTEDVMPEPTEDVMPESTEDAALEDVEDVIPETTEDATPETKEEADETVEAEDEVPGTPAVIVESFSISSNDGTEAGISTFSLRNISFQNCFGDQLEGLAKEIYDAMVDAYVTQEKTGNIEASFAAPVTFDVEISGNLVVENDAYNEACDKINTAFGNAYQGLLKDYPRVLWIKSLSIGYNVRPERSEESASGWKGVIDGCILQPEEYAEKYSEKIGEFNSGVANAKNAVKVKLGEGAAAYDILRAIHDYLCEQLEYNDDALSGDPSYLYAHNVYTVFAGNKKVVCEGYAKAFKVLCDEFGIPCILATGLGDTGESAEAHMWNCVKMEDGKWYAVDVTWDDQSMICYNHFLAGKNTKGFKDKSFAEEHIADGSFVYPELADKEYVPCDHEWEIKQEEIPATCTTAGSRTKKEVCKKCQSVKYGSEKTETIAVLGHDYQETVTEATCTKEGSKTKTCTRCGDTVTETVPMIDHVYEEKVDTVEATCTEAGSRTTKEVCKQCQSVKPGSEKKEIIEALGHDYQETIINAATCTKEGSKTKTCTRCGDKVTETIPKVPHTYGEWEEIKAATCTETGEREHVCEVCRQSETAAVEALGHDYEETVTKEATCTEEGSKIKTCTRCGDEVPETIPKALHTYDKWILKQAATGAGSVMERKCAVCGEIQTEEVAADGTSVSGKLIAYQVIEGANTAWKDGSSAGIRIRVDGEFEKFQSVWIDGALISSDHYTAEKGSTIINLKTSYLATLSKGSHVITVLYEDGQSATTFSVSERTADPGPSSDENKTNNNIPVQNTAASKPESAGVQTTAPKTGDTASFWLCAVILFAGFACIKMFLDKHIEAKYERKK